MVLASLSRTVQGAEFAKANEAQLPAFFLRVPYHNHTKTFPQNPIPIMKAPIMESLRDPAPSKAPPKITPRSDSAVVDKPYKP